MTVDPLAANPPTWPQRLRDDLVDIFQDLGWTYDGGDYNNADALIRRLYDRNLSVIHREPHPLPAVGVLQRDEDETGVSGTGTVAWIVEFPDGTTVTRWAATSIRQTCVWESTDHVDAIHGHNGKTRTVWADNIGAPWPLEGEQL